MWVYGETNTKIFSNLEIFYVPCNTRSVGEATPYWLPELDGCIDDLQAQKEYIKTPMVRFYYSKQDFVPEAFGDETIVRRSYLLSY